jgi:hypothetical protein
MVGIAPLNTAVKTITDTKIPYEKDREVKILMQEPASAAEKKCYHATCVIVAGR